MEWTFQKTKSDKINKVLGLDYMDQRIEVYIS